MYFSFDILVESAAFPLWDNFLIQAIIAAILCYCVYVMVVSIQKQNGFLFFFIIIIYHLVVSIIFLGVFGCYIINYSVYKSRCLTRMGNTIINYIERFDRS